jgi:lipopolysaccharide export system permease protein
MSMRILDRYIARNVGMSIFIVLSVLLTLFAFFAFMDESSQIGKGRYGAREAFQYVLLTMPLMMYQLFPVSALLGATIGLGLMAGNSELVVMRAAGVSLSRIIGSVMKVGLVLVLLTIAIGEGVAPVAERYAQTLRSVAISDKLGLRGNSGLWARDGNTFVNIRNILPGERLGQIYIYERDASNRLTRLVRAESAVYRRNQWILEGVVSSDIAQDHVTSRHVARSRWDTSLSPDLLNVVTVKPNTLSIIGLYQYITYLHDNGLDSATYEQALWGKIVAPLVTAVMVFLAIPFVFGPLRSAGAGHRILVGMLAGVGFYILNQMFTYMGIVFTLDPILSAVAPAALAFLAGYYMLRRVH